MPVAAHIRFQRFFTTTTDEDDLCWEWTGGLFKDSGYGKFNAGTHPENRTVYTHRYSWEINVGPIPKGIWVLHRCDNRPCVRPSHLFLGTAKDNYDDMEAKGRRVIAVPFGDDHGMSRLTCEIVRQIRSKYSLDRRGDGRKAANEFGVSVSTISRVMRGEIWRHVK